MNEEHERLKQAFERAQKEPVLIPTTLTSKTMAAQNVEFFIVHRGSAIEPSDHKLQT